MKYIIYIQLLMLMLMIVFGFELIFDSFLTKKIICLNYNGFKRNEIWVIEKNNHGKYMIKDNRDGYSYLKILPMGIGSSTIYKESASTFSDTTTAWSCAEYATTDQNIDFK